MTDRRKVQLPPQPEPEIDMVVHEDGSTTIYPPKNPVGPFVNMATIVLINAHLVWNGWSWDTVPNEGVV